MDTRRLQYLVELARLGSMRAVAEHLGATTSTVSQQIAALARDAGTGLVEPDGRRVRLTPAGRRLAAHGVTILAAVETARRDLDPDAEPAGTVRVAGFATAVRRSLLPLVPALAASHPRVRLVLAEHEPQEALALLADDAIDLALVYDYDLAPRAFGDRVDVTRLWSTRWGLGVPAGEATAVPDGDTLAVWRHHAGRPWIVNSRNTADEEVVAALGALAGVVPRVEHRADTLELVEDLIVAGLGVGLLPERPPPGPGVRVVPLRDPAVRLRAHAVVARGRAAWAPLALLLDRLSVTP